MTVPAAQASKASSRGVNALTRGRIGKIRTAFRAAVAEARRQERMTAEHELVAALAEPVAALADRCVSEGDGPGLLRAVSSLRDLVDTLPIRVIREEVPDDDRADGGAQLRSIMGGAPTVGHASDA